MIGCETNNSILGNTQGFGLFVVSGTSDRYVVTGNNFTGNAAGSVSDAGTGTNKKISGNVGYVVPAIAPSFLSSWVNFGSLYTNAGYWKDADGMVHLTGLVKSGTVGQPIFQLPAGYRPATQQVFAAISNGAIAQVDVATHGDVLATTGNLANFALSGILFRAA